MQFHTFGNPHNKAIVLIHGVLTPWQMWDYQIEHLKNDFYVIVPALDGHTEDSATEFVSVEKEAEAIENYLLDNLGGEVYAVCGISMGGVISSLLWQNGRIKLSKLVMDGAPLSPLPGFLIGMMTSNYLSIVHASQKRDPKTLAGFTKNLLPEKYLQNYLDIVDIISDTSIRNMVRSVFGDHYPENASRSVEVLFMHGTRANEIASVRAAKRLRRDYPDLRIIRHKGLLHCENACFHPDRWFADVIGFLGA